MVDCTPTPEATCRYDDWLDKSLALTPVNLRQFHLLAKEPAHPHYQIFRLKKFTQYGDKVVTAPIINNVHTTYILVLTNSCYSNGMGVA